MEKGHKWKRVRLEWHGLKRHPRPVYRQAGTGFRHGNVGPYLSVAGLFERPGVNTGPSYRDFNPACHDRTKQDL